MVGRRLETGLVEPAIVPVAVVDRLVVGAPCAPVLVGATVSFPRRDDEPPERSPPAPAGSGVSLGVQ